MIHRYDLRMTCVSMKQSLYLIASLMYNSLVLRCYYTTLLSHVKGVNSLYMVLFLSLVLIVRILVTF